MSQNYNRSRGGQRGNGGPYGPGVFNNYLNRQDEEEVHLVSRNPNFVRDPADSANRQRYRTSLLGHPIFGHQVPQPRFFDDTPGRFNVYPEPYNTQNEQIVNSTAASTNSESWQAGQNSMSVNPVRKTVKSIQHLGVRQRKISDFRDPEKLFERFRSVECQGCQQHFCFQSRTEKDKYYCSALCTEEKREEVHFPQVDPLETYRALPSRDVENLNGNNGTCRGRFNVNLDPQGNNFQRGKLDLGRRGNNTVDREGFDALRNNNINTNRGGRNFDQRSDNGELIRCLGGHGGQSEVPVEQFGGRGAQFEDHRRYSGGLRRRQNGGGAYSSPNPLGNSNVEDEWTIPATSSTDVTDTSRAGTARTAIEDVGNQNRMGKINSPEVICSVKSTLECMASSRVVGMKSVYGYPPESGSVKSAEVLPKIPSIFPKGSIPTPTVKSSTLFLTPQTKAIGLKLLSLSSEIPWCQLELGVQQIFQKTHTNSIHDFFIQSKNSSSTAALLRDQINTHLQESPVRLKSLEIGTLCLAPFEGSYYRAEITEIKNNPPTYSLFFCDYGNEGNVSGNKFFEMPPALRKEPRCAVRCRWDRAELEQLPDSQLKNLVESIVLHMTPKEKISEGHYLLSLSNSTPKSGNGTTPKEVCTPTTSSSILSSPKPSSERDVPDIPMKVKAVSAASSNRPKIWNINNCKYSAAIATGAQVKISYPWGFTRFLITAVEDENSSIKLQKQIWEGNFEPTKQIPKIGDILLGQYEGAYYRGQVVEILNDAITLEFVDYGDQVTLRWKELLLPTDKLMKHPIYGMNIMLHGVATEPPGAQSTKQLNDVINSTILQVVFTHKAANNAEAQLILPDNTTTMSEIVNKMFADALNRGA